MNKNQKKINFRRMNWKIPVFIVSASMSVFLVISFFFHGNFFTAYGVDYLAFWSAGKIADQNGYSEIYDINNLRSVQMQEFNSLGLISRADTSSLPTICVPYFAFFVLPFQILSKIDVVLGYWLWTMFNLILLIGYVIFFLRKIQPEFVLKEKRINLLIPILISYAVLSNFFSGQVSVFLLICTGEFIRNAIEKKPILSGLWLAGLLIKPQLLILIIPIIFVKRNWEILKGFFASAGIILATSFMMSGSYGTKALINLWFRYSTGSATVNPEAMINWRMIGYNLNFLSKTSLGWVITGPGIVMTILMLYFLIKKNSPHGSPSWMITMLGVFSATLSVTWHAHNHMAMVLIPFLVYASIYSLLPDNIIFLWATTTQVIWFGMIIIGASANASVIAVAISGFALNLLIFVSALRTFYNRTL